MSGTELLAEFIRSFEMLDDMLAFEPTLPDFRGVGDDSLGRMEKW